ncbi:hypothetical protein LY78DRAFT_728405, partial [Colletotrichum sublineola]
ILSRPLASSSAKYCGTGISAAPRCLSGCCPHSPWCLATYRYLSGFTSIGGCDSPAGGGSGPRCCFHFLRHRKNASAVRTITPTPVPKPMPIMVGRGSCEGEGTSEAPRAEDVVVVKASDVVAS